jgi:O-antigen ligase
MKLRFTWWQAAWLVMFMSGWSFRARSAAEISESPVDAFAAYRILCVGIVALILFLRLTLRKTNWLPSLFSGLVGIFILYPLLSLLSTVWSVNPLWTAYKSLEFSVDVSLLAAIVATLQSVTEYRRFINWTWTLLGFLIVTSWIGAFINPAQGLYGNGDPNLHAAVMSMRLFGIVPVVSSNDLAEISAILGLVSLCRIFMDEDSQRWKNRYWYVFAVACVTLIFTQTRGAFLAFLVGLVALLILTRKYLLVAVGGVTSFVIIVPLLVLTKLGDQVQNFLLRGQTAEGASGMSGRLETWQASLEKVAQHPLTGYGGFGAKFVILSKASEGSDTLSSYIDSLLNIGVFGFLLLVVVVFLAGRSLFRSMRDFRLSQAENYLALEMFIIFIVLSIRSVESSNLVTHPMISFLTILSVAEFFRRRRRLATSTFFPNTSVTG